MLQRQDRIAEAQNERENNEQKEKQKKKKAISCCVSCNKPSTILIHAIPFCRECFIDKFQKIFLSELRKSLAHTERRRKRRVLVFLEDTVSSQVLYHLCINTTSATIEYDYCRTKSINIDNLDSIDNIDNLIYIPFESSSIHSNIDAAVEYAKREHYDCLLIGHYSVEIALHILQMITKGEIDMYAGVYNRQDISICLPFFTVSFKSLLYFAFISGIFDKPVYAKNEILPVGTRAHHSLIRDLLKNSSNSILNLIHTQHKINLNSFSYLPIEE